MKYASWLNRCMVGHLLVFERVRGIKIFIMIINNGNWYYQAMEYVGTTCIIKSFILQIPL